MSQLTGRLGRAALAVSALLQHVPKLVKERDGLKEHVRRLAAEHSELEEHFRNLEGERDSLKRHVQRLEDRLRPCGAVPGTYGSPIVDPDLPSTLRAVEAQRRWEWQGAPLVFDEDAMMELFYRLSRHYSDACFPDARTAGWRYSFGNPTFSYADGITLFGMIREFGPKRIVEAGAGFSSCLMMDTNDRFCGGAIDLHFLDPHPELLLSLLEPDDPYRRRIRPIALQEESLDLFESLGENDILFIDSSHIAKTGSDVNDYCFRVLPALKSGALVHIHDILYPFEYPAEWIVADKRSWNEAYLLRAFLEFNDAFSVIFFNDWFYNRHADVAAQHMPRCCQQTGGSLWLRRR
jgi:hypothetical protein